MHVLVNLTVCEPSGLEKFSDYFGCENGIDLMINPQIVLAHELAQIAHSHGALHVIELADHHVELAQVEISEHSRLLNRSLDRLSKTLPSQTLVAAVVRRGELFIPGGSDILLANDRVYIVGLPNQMSAAEDLFTRKREAHTVAIGGGSVVGEALARELAQTDAEVILFEKNHDRHAPVGAHVWSRCASPGPYGTLTLR